MSELEKKGAAEAGAIEVPATELVAIRQEFDRRWWRQLAISGQVALIGLPAILLTEHMSPDGPPAWAFAIAAVSIVGGLIGSLWNWRCPSCHRYFGKRFLFMKFCGRCGIPLVEA